MPTLTPEDHIKLVTSALRKGLVFKSISINGVLAAAPEATQEQTAATQAYIDGWPNTYVPESVTKYQASAALIEIGVNPESVDVLIAAMPDGQSKWLAKAAWNSGTVRRDHPLVASLGPALGLTTQQIDNLFTYASTIQQ